MTWKPAEIQTTIDETTDGGWEGVILVGSNFEARINGGSYREVAAALAASIDLLLRQRSDAAEFWERRDAAR